MRRIVELDSIRGLAALSVVTCHMAPRIAPVGWTAVDCFFVLSGYLITAILLRNRTDPRLFTHFYARRALRIWPIYYLILAAAVAIGVAMRGHLPPSYYLDGLPYYLTYTQNIWLYWGGTEARFVPALAHTWTLAIEEQFYLIWPPVVLLAGRRWLAPIALACLAGSVAVRSSGYSAVLLISRADGFALGGLLAVLLADPEAVAARLPRFRALFALIAAAAAGWLARVHFFPDILPMSVLYFALIGLAVLHAGHPWLAPLRWRALAYIGVISYGLYLYHIPVIHVTELVLRRFGSGHPFGPERPLWRSALEMALSLGVAHLSWRYIERPILGLKDRFRYHQGSSPSPSPSVEAPLSGVAAVAMAD